MKKTLFHTYKDMKKNKVVLEELQRAHLIIALLSVSLAFIVAVSSIHPIQFEELLASVAASLLIILAAISMSVYLMIKAK